MPSVFIITKELETARGLQAELSKWGFVSLTANYNDKIVEQVAHETPDLVLLELNEKKGRDILQQLTTGSKARRKIPVLGLISSSYLAQPDDNFNVDDFILLPCDIRELAIRASRLVQNKTSEKEMFRCGDLVINLANCEVRVAGRIVELTFKEYELLTFLAKDRGRVFTRESLLNKVWGYDYFGGDRTVDVHVRRLRSKIEIAEKTYIETVRNIGYRFTTNC